MRKTTRLVMMASGLVALLALSMPRSARAHDIFDLSSPNAGLSGFTGPYAQVDISLNTTTHTAGVTFASLTNGGNIYLVGDGTSVGLNVNATSFSLEGTWASNSGTGFSPGPLRLVNPPGTSNVDGFGSFDLTIDDFDGFSNSVDQITFTITDTGTTTWSSANDVLTTNANGADAEAHVFVTSSPANASNGALATRYAAKAEVEIFAPPPPTTTPESTSMLLFAVGAVILGFAARRRETSLLAA